MNELTSADRLRMALVLAGPKVPMNDPPNFAQLEAAAARLGRARDIMDLSDAELRSRWALHCLSVGEREEKKAYRVITPHAIVTSFGGFFPGQVIAPEELTTTDEARFLLAGYLEEVR